MEKKINLGSGNDYREGWTNVDCSKQFKVDYDFNLNELPYPFEDNTFNEVLMKQIIEHLDKPMEVLKEIHRICKHGALIQINTPHFSSSNAWSDIEHKRPYGIQTFTNLCEFHGLFKVIKQEITFSHFKFYMRPFVKLMPFFYEKHLAYIFTAVDLRATMKVIK